MPIENCKLSPTEAIADGVGVLVDDGTGCGKTLLGPAGYYLRVNGAGDGLEWVQAHEPVHFETGDEPFAWDDALQCGVIPLPGRLVDNGDGTFTFDPGNGRAPTTLRYGWTESTVMGSVVTFAYPDGTILDVDVCALIAQNCDATLADNGNGTYTHTSNSGVQTTFRGGWTEASVTGRAITFAYPDGTTLDVDLCALVAANCDVSLVENGDGTWTHRSIGGVQTRFPGGWTTVVDNGDSTLTVTTPDGAVQTIDVCALVAAHCDATLVENGDGTLTHTSNSGVQTTFSEGAGATHPAATLTNDDASFAWDDATQTGNIPVTTLTENVDGTVVINPGNGDPDVTIHAPVMLTNDDAPFAWNDATQTGNIPVTSITDNGDNTITVNPGNGAPSVTFCDGIVLNRPDDPTDEQLTRYDAAACTLTIPNALWGFKGRDFGAANIALPDGVFVNPQHSPAADHCSQTEKHDPIT